nr:superinfection immunity protein [Campylobacter jejuni]
MLPAIIGLSRKHSNWLIISLLNLFFGCLACLFNMVFYGKF